MLHWTKDAPDVNFSPLETSPDTSLRRNCRATNNSEWTTSGWVQLSVCWMSFWCHSVDQRLKVLQVTLAVSFPRSAQTLNHRSSSSFPVSTVLRCPVQRCSSLLICWHRTGQRRWAVNECIKQMTHIKEVFRLVDVAWTTTRWSWWLKQCKYVIWNPSS